MNVPLIHRIIYLGEHFSAAEGYIIVINKYNVAMPPRAINYLSWSEAAGRERPSQKSIKQSGWIGTAQWRAWTTMSRQISAIQRATNNYATSSTKILLPISCVSGYVLVHVVGLFSLPLTGNRFALSEQRFPLRMVHRAINVNTFAVNLGFCLKSEMITCTCASSSP